MEIQEKNGFSILGFIAQVLLVVIFVFVLMLLFPTKSYMEKNGNGTGTGNSTALTEILFNQNLLAMKDAAREYFTVKRMPATNGSSKTLTLEEMIKNKMVVELIDANGEKCDQKASYVKVTKVDSEYEMEVSLTCGKVTKTIKTTIGCYNYCESGLCEKQAAQVTLYQYSKTIKGTSKWSDWSSWSKTKVTETSTRKVETKVVNEKTGTKTVTTPAIATTSYTCPDGYTMSEDKKTCTGAGKTIDATKIINYSCPDGYDLTEDKKNCVSTTTIDAKKELYCESGKLQGTDCILGQKTEYEYTSIVCEKPGYLSDSKTQCVHETVIGAAIPGVYTTLDSCNQAHGTCAPTSISGYYLYCNSGVLNQYTNQCVKKTYSSLCPTGFSLTSDKTRCARGYKVDLTVPARTRYTCATGEVQGNKCVTTITIQSTENVSYKCSAGELQGDKCVLTAIIASTENTTYSCKTGSLNSNTNLCENTVDVYSDVTYYRYKTYTTTQDTVVYKWSESNNDSKLLKDGYKLTGKTKTTTK